MVPTLERNKKKKEKSTKKVAVADLINEDPNIGKNKQNIYDIY
ncbi:hypothetical protein DOY81_005706 [Sarcophaga bullata]|nr:hypothetical protein DOY81_005706 [Sarcophaga bullata]